MITRKLSEKIAIFLWATLTLLLTTNTTRADVSQTDADNRAKALKSADTPEDSIKILLDVYDLSDKINRNQVGMQILDLAKRTDNHAIAADVLNDLASATDDTKSLKELIAISESLPAHEGSKTMETILQMEEAKAEAGEIKGKALQQKIFDSSVSGLTIGGDPYQEIQNIYRALVFLGASTQGPMYFEYILRLGDLVENLPEKDHAIKNLYYTTAALFYTRKRDYKKAIELDRKLIKEIEAVQKEFEKEGRQYHDFDYFYFVSYRRMLRNFRGLTPEEIEDVYAKCVELAERNEEVNEEFNSAGLAKSYYYFATAQYDKAVPELKKALNTPNISDFRRQELLGLLAGAQHRSGDYEGELNSLREYALMSIADRQKQYEDSAKEIELRNSVNQILAKEREIDLKRQQHRRIMRKTSLTLVYVLAVILILMCRSYFRLRHKVKELEKRNNRLRTDIEYIFDDGTPRGTSDLRHSKNKLKG